MEDESSVTAFSHTETMTIVPTYISKETSMGLDGKTYYLRPKSDLTAYELFNINVWIEEAKLNSCAFNTDKFYSRAEELGIIRHFECA